MVMENLDTVLGSYEWIHAINVLSASFYRFVRWLRYDSLLNNLTFTLGEVESSLSNKAGIAWGAKCLVEEIHS